MQQLKEVLECADSQGLGGNEAPPMCLPGPKRRLTPYARPAGIRSRVSATRTILLRYLIRGSTALSGPSTPAPVFSSPPSSSPIQSSSPLPLTPPQHAIRGHDVICEPSPCHPSDINPNQWGGIASPEPYTFNDWLVHVCQIYEMEPSLWGRQ